jgi:hypothetical protein
MLIFNINERPHPCTSAGPRTRRRQRRPHVFARNRNAGLHDEKRRLLQSFDHPLIRWLALTDGLAETNSTQSVRRTPP